MFWSACLCADWRAYTTFSWNTVCVHACVDNSYAVPPPNFVTCILVCTVQYVYGTVSKRNVYDLLVVTVTLFSSIYSPLPIFFLPPSFFFLFPLPPSELWLVNLRSMCIHQKLFMIGTSVDVIIYTDRTYCACDAFAVSVAAFDTPCAVTVQSDHVYYFLGIAQLSMINSWEGGVMKWG